MRKSVCALRLLQNYGIFFLLSLFSGPLLKTEKKDSKHKTTTTKMTAPQQHEK